MNRDTNGGAKGETDSGMNGDKNRDVSREESGGGEMSCESAGEQIGPYIDGELPPGARAELERHLESCQRCRGELERLRRLSGLVRGLGREKAPEGLAARIARATVAQGPPGARVLRLPRWAGAAAAAAAVLLVGVVGLVAVRERGGSRRAAERKAAAPLSAPAARARPGLTLKFERRRGPAERAESARPAARRSVVREAGRAAAKTGGAVAPAGEPDLPERPDVADRGAAPAAPRAPATAPGAPGAPEPSPDGRAGGRPDELSPQDAAPRALAAAPPGASPAPTPAHEAEREPGPEETPVAAAVSPEEERMLRFKKLLGQSRGRAGAPARSAAGPRRGTPYVQVRLDPQSPARNRIPELARRCGGRVTGGITASGSRGEHVATLVRVPRARAAEFLANLEGLALPEAEGAEARERAVVAPRAGGEKAAAKDEGRDEKAGRTRDETARPAEWVTIEILIAPAPSGDGSSKTRSGERAR